MKLIIFIKKLFALSKFAKLDNDDLIFYINGPQTLPTPLSAEEESEAIAKMKDDPEKRMIKSLVDALGEREKQIIELRFGLRGGRELTQKEVADMLGISQSYISRLEKKIIERLKEQIESSL